MVGLQASLRTSVQGGMDLTKNENEDFESNTLDEGDSFGDDDVFDPDELLNSPMFNDPAATMGNEDSFGSFAIDEEDGSELNASYSDYETLKTSAVTNSPFAGCRDSLPSSSPKRSVSGPSSLMHLYQSPTNHQHQQQEQQEPAFDTMQQGLQQNPLPRSPPKSKLGMLRSPGMTMRQSPKRAVSYSEGHQSMKNQMSGMQMNQHLNQMRFSGSGTGLSQSMHTNFSHASPLASSHNAVHGDSLDSGSVHSVHSVSVQSGSTQGPPVQDSSMNAQHMQAQHMNPQLMNMQQMQAQQMNGQMMNGQPMNGQLMNGQLMNGQSMQNQQMHPGQASPSYAPFQGNVSIASDMQTQKPNMQSFDQAGLDQPTFGQPQNSGMGQQKAPATINDAMEKLCESMKRSAMTRNLVKQSSVASRGVMRQNSFNGVARQNSLRGVMRQNSARGSGLQQSSLMDESSGRGAPPVRRMSMSKHRIQHHSRGVYRHDSQQSLNGNSNHGINFQNDLRNITS
jgi:hypothetical protein